MDATALALNRAIDSVNSADAGETSWGDVARYACEVVGADAGGVLAWRRSDRAVEVLEGYGFETACVQDYLDGYNQQDVLKGAAEHASPNSWLVSNELFPDRLWGKHSFFGDFLHRHRVNQIVALVLTLDSERTIAFTFQRHTRRSDTARSLAEAASAQFSRRVSQVFATRESNVETAREALADSVMDADNLWFLVDSDGCPQTLTGERLFVERFGEGTLVADTKRIRHRNPEANDRLQLLMRNAARLGVRGTICLPVNATTAMKVTARPASARLKVLPSQRLALVQIERRDSRTPLQQAELQSLFGLTSAQARVLTLLCAGLSVNECAAALHCGEATVRSHVSHLMARMGCCRQGQLIRTAMLVA